MSDPKQMALKLVDTLPDTMDPGDILVAVGMFATMVLGGIDDHAQRGRAIDWFCDQLRKASAHTTLN